MAGRDAWRSRVLLSDVEFRTERVPHAATIEAASALMLASWPPPSLAYSPSLLAWHLGFPGTTEPVAVTGWRGTQCVAFAAATPRRVRIGAWSGPVMIKSFMTVDESLRGRGIGAELRERVVREIASQGHPLLRFGEQTPEFQRVLARDYAKAGMHLRFLGPCVAAATLARGPLQGEELTADEFIACWKERAADAVINPSPDRTELAHYLCDPRQRRLIGVRDRGALVAAAMAVRTMVAARRGLEASAQLEQLMIGPDAGPEQLTQLAAHAAYWAYAGDPGVVTIPNIGDNPWPRLAAAGFRKLATRYSVWAASTAESHPLFGSVATNLEVV